MQVHECVGIITETRNQVAGDLQVGDIYRPLESDRVLRDGDCLAMITYLVVGVEGGKPDGVVDLVTGRRYTFISSRQCVQLHGVVSVGRCQFPRSRR